MAGSRSLTATIWRWHFYAGLLVIPFVLILSVTGGLYLFKPDWDRWQEAAYRGLPAGPAVGAEAQLAAALAASPPGTRWHSFRLPEHPGDAAMIHVAQPGGAMRDIYVAPGGAVLGSVDPAKRISAVLQRIHGTLLLGQPGSLLVELAASWAILLILTGLYLWWPKGRQLAGVLYPRRGHGWRDLHAVTGFWVSGLALVLLVTGLPWTDGWAAAFRTLRGEMGWVNARPQEWKGGADPHAAHDHAAMMAMDAPAAPMPGLGRIAALAAAEHMPFPALIQPPGAPGKFGPPNGADWKLTTEVQDRTQVRSVFYDAQTGAVTRREGFAGLHPLDQAINTGIAWHEGQLLGRFNQAVGVMTALMLILIAVSGTVMWWRKRPAGGIGAPRRASGPVPRGWLALLVIAGLLLPVLGVSLILVAGIEWATAPLRKA